MACAGDGSELCGGPNRLNMYHSNSTNGFALPAVVPSYGNFVYIGCVVEPATTRALPNLVVANGSVTVELCLQSCVQYTYAGLEYGE